EGLALAAELRAVPVELLDDLEEVGLLEHRGGPGVVARGAPQAGRGVAADDDGHALFGRRAHGELLEGVMFAMVLDHAALEDRADDLARFVHALATRLEALPAPLELLGQPAEPGPEGEALAADGGERA